MSSRTSWRWGRVLALCALLVVPAAGCSGAGTPTGSTSTEAPSVSGAPGRSAPSTADEPSTPSPDGGVRGTTDALLRAGRAGLDRVAGSTVYSIESERQGDVWQVEVVTPDGTKHEMYVSRDGRSMMQSPTRSSTKAEYRDRVQRARIGYRAAVAAVLDAVPGATFTELGLDDDHGVIVWEADVVARDGTVRSVKVDAVTAKVLENKIDT